MFGDGASGVSWTENDDHHIPTEALIDASIMTRIWGWLLVILAAHPTSAGTSGPKVALPHGPLQIEPP